MARPKIADESKKRTRLSISVSQDVKAVAEKSGNASRYFEDAVHSMNAIAKICKRLGKRINANDLLDAMEDIQDIAACWESLGEETFSWELIKAELARKDVRTKKREAAPRAKRATRAATTKRTA